MRKKILVNAGKEELRVATLNGNVLEDLVLQVNSNQSTRSNIYLGKVSRIEPSLEAVFVNYGDERHGFLSFKELTDNFFESTDSPSNNDRSDRQNQKSRTGEHAVILPTDAIRSIEDMEEHEHLIDVDQEQTSPPKNRGALKLKVGDTLIVQVSRDKRGTKGASLTCYVSLPGRYLVFLPFSYRNFVGGISKRIDGNYRRKIKDLIHVIKYPADSNFIIRTVGADRDASELQEDLDFLIGLWNEIQDSANKANSPALLFCENELQNLLIRDYLDDSIEQVLIDSPELFERCSSSVKAVLPSFVERIQLYNDDIPLFSKFGLERKIQELYSKKVELPSGGNVVIDTTEALISVDVNSAKSNNLRDVEETAFKTNLEAATAIAMELRLRDLGGLIVIDFIDMSSQDHQNQVKNTLVNELRKDKAKIQVGDLSKFGLLEMSRQRIGTAIYDINCHDCPRCSGTGKIRSSDSLVSSIMLIIQDEIVKKNVQALVVELPTILATFIINNKRAEIYNMELKFSKKIRLVPNGSLETPHYIVKSINANNYVSTIIDTMTNTTSEKDMTPTEQIAYANPLVHFDYNKQSDKKPVGFFGRILAWFKGEEKKEAKPYAKRSRNHNRSKGPQQQKRRIQNNRRPRPEGRSEKPEGRPEKPEGRPERSEGTNANTKET